MSVVPKRSGSKLQVVRNFKRAICRGPTVVPGKPTPPPPPSPWTRPSPQGLSRGPPSGGPAHILNKYPNAPVTRHSRTYLRRARRRCRPARCWRRGRIKAVAAGHRTGGGGNSAGEGGGAALAAGSNSCGTSHARVGRDVEGVRRGAKLRLYVCPDGVGPCYRVGQVPHLEKRDGSRRGDQPRPEAQA